MTTTPRITSGGATALLLASLALVGCGESEEPTSPPPETTTSAPPEPSRADPPATGAPSIEDPSADPGAGDPLADLAAPVRADEVVEAHPSPLASPTLEPGICAEVTEAPVRVLPRSSPFAIVSARDRFYLAAYEPLDAGREQVSIVELRAGQAPRLVVSIPVVAPASRRSAAPALALVGGEGNEAAELGVAFVDGSGVVRAAFLDPSRPAPRAIETTLVDADPRFAPALARIGTQRVIAATIAMPENVAAGQPPRTAMRMHVARLDARGEELGHHDVSPRAGGGSHPLFAPGANGASDLFFIDARVALSVIHRVGFDEEVMPGEASVARPVNLSAEPPSFAITRASGRELAIYAAVGNMATRAVGVVEIGGTDNPDAVVPGLGYGQPLTVRAITRTTDAIVVSEAPSAVAADAPHEVRVRTIRVSDAGARTLGEPLVLAGVTRPSIAIDADGAIAIALEGGLVRFVRCGA